MKFWKKILITVLGILGCGITFTFFSNNNISIVNSDCNSCREFTAKKKGFECRILVLGQEYSWKLGDSELTEQGIPIGNIIPSRLNQDGLSKCSDIIAIGTASEEIEKSVDDENDRARRRASNIIRELRPEISNEINLLELVLGKYKGNDETKSYLQRRIIVVGILEKNETTINEDIKWALKNCQNELNLNIQNYELFELKNASYNLIK